MKVAELQLNSRIQPLQTPKPRTAPTVNETEQIKKQGGFGGILKKTIDEQQAVRFSAHALRRLEERDMPLTEQVINRLDNGIKQLQEKGARNSLVLIDETAYVVSVKNKTVVTAVNNAQSEQNVFTNIDGVAIV